jgi:hypothetical protein
MVVDGLPIKNECMVYNFTVIGETSCQKKTFFYFIVVSIRFLVISYVIRGFIHRIDLLSSRAIYRTFLLEHSYHVTTNMFVVYRAGH